MKRLLLTHVLFVFLGIVLCLPSPSAAKSEGRTGMKVSDLNTVRGVVKPVAESIISSEVQAQVMRLPFRDGQRFKKGQLLVEFGCAKYRAELAAAKADVNSRKKTLVNNRELAKLRGIGQLEVEIAQAEMDKAKAIQKGAQVTVNRCRITAPFTGRVVKRLVHQYESVNPYDEIISILDDRAFEIELILPSTSLRWVEKTSPFSFYIDETKEVLSAEVVGLGARIDPVSQTIRVFGQFKASPKDILAGMSGSARFTDRKLKTKTRFNPSTKQETMKKPKTHQAAKK